MVTYNAIRIKYAMKIIATTTFEHILNQLKAL